MPEGISDRTTERFLVGLLVIGLRRRQATRVGRLKSQCKGSAFGIRLPLAEHLPDHGGELSHDGHPSDGTATPASDAFVPFSE